MKDRTWLTRLLVLTQGSAVLLTLFMFPSSLSTAPREHHLAALGYVLPEAFWDTPLPYVFAGLGFLVGIVLWAASSFPRVGAIVSLLGLLVLGSWRAENDLYATHQLFVPFSILTIVGAATIAGNTLAVPRSTFRYAVILLGFGYTTSGLEKLWASGLTWAEGDSLRLWLNLPPAHPVAAWLASQPILTSIGQMVVLAAETFAVLGLAFPRTRLPFGVVLLGFHFCLEWWMGLAFYGNEAALLVLCGVWPVSEGWPRNADRSG